MRSLNVLSIQGQGRGRGVGAAFALLAGCAVSGAAFGQQATYESPSAALEALKNAVSAKDAEGLRKVFGPAIEDLKSGDKVQDEANLEIFARRLGTAARLENESAEKAIIHVGPEEHPFPVPIVQKDGKWRFDTEAGKEEILNRRIGENELGAISVCHGYVAAQYEYFSQDRDGDDVLEFAQRVSSTEGKRDGLFWESKADEPPSPLGPFAAQARAEGYGKSDAVGDQKPRPYHGYVYKLLTRQGEKAPGGKFDYVINGNMLAGFALAAYPVDWGASGIMTFVVSANGKVYQKDLGEKTAEAAVAIVELNPDDTWKLVED